jgi:hypothetical protein
MLNHRERTLDCASRQLSRAILNVPVRAREHTIDSPPFHMLARANSLSFGPNPYQVTDTELRHSIGADIYPIASHSS